MSALRPIPELPIAAQVAGLRWLLAEERWRGLAKGVGQVIGHPDPRTAGVEIIKHRDRRLIFRIAFNGDSAVAKSFPMRGVWHTLRQAQRYGPASLHHLVQAARLGLPVPRVYAYGERRKWGLLHNSVIVMEDISWPTVSELLRPASDDERRLEILSVVTNLLLQLYKAGCNHVDTNDTNILIGPDRREVRIIDLQYARFLRHASPAVLMAQAARFRLSCLNSHSAEEGVLDEWLQRLLAAAGLRGEDGWLELHHRFFTWPLSLRERLKLK